MRCRMPLLRSRGQIWWELCLAGRQSWIWTVPVRSSNLDSSREDEVRRSRPFIPVDVGRRADSADGPWPARWLVGFDPHLTQDPSGTVFACRKRGSRNVLLTSPNVDRLSWNFVRLQMRLWGVYSCRYGSSINETWLWWTKSAQNGRTSHIWGPQAPTPARPKSFRRMCFIIIIILPFICSF